PRGTEVLLRDLDADPLELDLSRVDVILLLDVIEHLQEPERFLAALRRNLDHRPRTLILTTPNVAFGIQRLMLLAGQFNYGKAGILDRTHTRLFTFRSLRRLLVDSGLRIREVRGVPAPFPKALGNNPLGMGLLRLNEALIHVSPAFFSYQIFVEAETTPDVAFVLADSRRSGEPPATLERPARAAAARRGRRSKASPRKTRR
ncbi:MAG TPA: methyltransferase domain-containing protein, partial [Myxococcaceae bacterium]|nr:methyltransferase domain-containing protein [Myxococcaceae bacterium]